jgi:hypothetical protein
MTEMDELVTVTTKAALHSSSAGEEVLAVIEQIVMVFDDISSVTDSVNNEMKRFTFRPAA